MDGLRACCVIDKLTDFSRDDISKGFSAPNFENEQEEDDKNETFSLPREDPLLSLFKSKIEIKV